MTQNIIKTWGKHLAAIAVLLVITIAYFSPAVLDGKVIQQGDMLKADGMGNSQMKQYEETAEPGEFCLVGRDVWRYALRVGLWQSGA